MTLSRRTFLGGLLALPVAACSGGDDTATEATTTTGPEPSTTTVAPGPGYPFALGVASGDPDSTSVVLWTRLAADPLAPDGGVVEPIREVGFEVATDDGFRTLVAEGTAGVDDARGHSVHHVVDGLDPATTYAYRFTSGDHVSPVGLTRTAPAPDDDRAVRIGLASCQRYGDGYYVAHRDMAEADLDLVVWVGDYIYENQQGELRAPPAGAPGEARDLDGYRHRYATARLDPHLAANHAAHPWAVTWDDHEVSGDYTGGAPGADLERRAAAYQAWWEHMPVRLPPPEGATLAIHRQLRLGAHLDLLLLDTRQHRSARACGGGLIDATCGEIDDPARTMLGPEQDAWFDAVVGSSTATWTAVAQSVVLSRVDVLGNVNADAWDGYGAARDRILRSLAQARNPVVLTGDVHVQVVADVTDREGAVVAAELVTASVSSQPVGAYREATPLLPTVAEHVRHAADERGWLRCEVGGTAFRATFREVADVADPASGVADGAAFVVHDGMPGARPG